MKFGWVRLGEEKKGVRAGEQIKMEKHGQTDLRVKELMYRYWSEKIV